MERTAAHGRRAAAVADVVRAQMARLTDTLGRPVNRHALPVVVQAPGAAAPTGLVLVEAMPTTRHNQVAPG